MQTPAPVREHRALEKLAGHFSGPERMHPSYWNDEPKLGEAVTNAHVALDGFAVVQDYEQRLEDGSRFAGHGVFRYDMASETYELHWFDSTGGPHRIFRGGFEGRQLVLTARVGDGWQRLTYDFNLRKGYRMKLETSDDGQNWNVVLEGDNLADGNGRAGVARTKKAGAKKAAAGKTAARKAPSKKATAKKASTKKGPAKKASAKKASAKKTTARKATAKKSASKKATAKKAGAKKTPAKKTAARKTVMKKAPAKKATAGKTAARKTASRKTAAKKTAAGKAAKPKASAIERRRRQGKASKKVGAARRANGNGSAERATTSQKRSKGAAHKAPRMPELKSTSTRVGWHKTAAKGLRGS